MTGDGGVWLTRGERREDEVEALVTAAGGRVGLTGVLAALDRSAEPARVPGWAVDWGVALDAADQADARWWPQGVTTSADHDPTQLFDGRRLVLTTSYARRVEGDRAGSRLTVFDLTDPERVRYAHVLLVVASLGEDGLGLEPLRVHAGGALWVGEHLHVAATARGLVTFRLADIVPVPSAGTGAPGSPVRLGSGPEPAYGHRFLLPALLRYDASADPGVEPLRYSFLSLDRARGPGPGPGLVAGEYARGSMSRRLVRYALGPDGSLLAADGAGVSRPEMQGEGVRRMQGAAWVDGRLYVSASAGTHRGSLYVGRPGDLRRHRWALPPGPEALCHWPGADRLWSCSEHPGARYVFTVDRARLD